ncbi:MAG TPA: glycosyltransferase family 4 protein, partial [Terrimicrobiaceae bacterium]|nr:glycosyltransferase family 4 protein [Terrimicrobiaceae bacterium]
DISAYRRAADFLNLANVDVLCLQHEFGIFGGPNGRHVLTLLRNLRMPVVTTLHTILKEPTNEQKPLLQEVMQLSARVVAMTEKGRAFLRDVYGTPDEKIDLIPHGIPDVPFVDPNYYKDKFGVEGRPVLLTFGLISPNKGIENVLNALPEIVRKFPNVVYIVLGATHPNLILKDGETYRLGLERLAKKNGVEKNVIFFNRFVDKDELVECLGAADIYITPYLNKAQITSGTLAYSFGAGKAVISTPYWHAEELLADGNGVLVPFGESAPIAQAVCDLLRNEAARHTIRKSAYLLGRKMIWPTVAHDYIQSFRRARSEHSIQTVRSIEPATLDRLAALPVWKLDHLARLTDDTGILQHAVYTIPNHDHGYCTDDNARALILTMLMEELEESFPERDRLTSIYCAFLQNAFNDAAGRFRNFMSYDRKWLEEVGSEDSHARALWALGTCVGRSQGEGLRSWAAELFEKALPAVQAFRYPRAWAFTIIGLHEYLRTLSGDLMANQLRSELSQRLRERYEAIVSPDWLWFEDIAAYDNARLPHALIVTGRWANQPGLLETGLKTLRWLSDKQLAPEGHFRPIGSNGFWKRGGQRASFDQQPIDAHATICACIEAHEATGDRSWLLQANKAFEWFHGGNDLGLSLYDAQSGGCRDGLHIDRVNQNQGAESTLAFLLSLAEMRRIQSLTADHEKPANLAGSPVVRAIPLDVSPEISPPLRASGLLRTAS